MRLLLLVFLLIIGVGSKAQQLSADTNNFNNLPEVVQRRQEIKIALSAKLPIILKKKCDDQQALAQYIFINDNRLTNLFTNNNGDKLLNEIFNIYKIASTNSSLNEYRVELYNYAYNLSVIGIVDLNLKKVTEVITQQSTAPEIPEHLGKLAISIAKASKVVQQELIQQGIAADAIMAYTKTALNNSKCQRSEHLCVAPTFIKNDKALWCIIDLADMRLVGTKWTFIGQQDTISISERPLQNEVVTNCYCTKSNAINKLNWQADYIITSSDGLMISNVKYKGKQILNSAKLVDWHVSYSNSEGFGYSDGIGCPMYSLSAVVAWGAPTIADLIIQGKVVGFVLEQKFQSEGWPRACNYNYVQRYEFYSDGKFRPTTASIGRGCGSDGTYRPVFRFSFVGNNTFSQFSANTTYKNWQLEQWHLQSELTEYSQQGYLYKIKGDQNLYIEPNKGQFNDNSRGDNAYTYITKYKPQEGEQDLLTLGPCCNNNWEQGPEKYVNNENIINQQIVMWYVPQMKNDNTPGKEYCWAEAKIKDGVYTTITYPCFVGPMFVPINTTDN
jgi:hypothetical protein